MVIAEGRTRVTAEASMRRIMTGKALTRLLPGFRDHVLIAVGEDPGRLVEGTERPAHAWAEYQPTEPRSAASLPISV